MIQISKLKAGGQCAGRHCPSVALFRRARGFHSTRRSESRSDIPSPRRLPGHHGQDTASAQGLSLRVGAVTVTVPVGSAPAPHWHPGCQGLSGTMVRD